jgi:hypothetical protein
LHFFIENVYNRFMRGVKSFSHRVTDMRLELIKYFYRSQI